MNPLYLLSAGLGSPQFLCCQRCRYSLFRSAPLIQHVRPIGKQRLRAVSRPPRTNEPIRAARYAGRTNEPIGQCGVLGRVQSEIHLLPRPGKELTLFIYNKRNG